MDTIKLNVIGQDAAFDSLFKSWKANPERALQFCTEKAARSFMAWVKKEHVGQYFYEAKKIEKLFFDTPLKLTDIPKRFKAK